MVIDVAGRKDSGTYVVKATNDSGYAEASIGTLVCGK